MNMNSELKTWFEQRFGKRPEHMSRNDTDLIFMIEAGKKAEMIQREQHDWDIRFDTVLKVFEASKTLNKPPA